LRLLHAGWPGGSVAAAPPFSVDEVTALARARAGTPFGTTHETLPETTVIRVHLRSGERVVTEPWTFPWTNDWADAAGGPALLFIPRAVNWRMPAVLAYRLPDSRRAPADDPRRRGQK
jgi:hypothetical protein